MTTHTLSSHRMPRYLSAAQARTTSWGLGLLPLVTPIVLSRVTAETWDPVLFVATAVFWLVAFSTFSRMSVPSIAIGNAYREKMHAVTRSSRFAVWTRPDSQLRPLYWLNLVATVAAAVWLIHVFTSLYV